ncbi:anti-H(O) lectin 1-like [Pistacia vera]|uniref:anti-H(O) lectin 1-like n=1 Tax=Pistacia vera TaxID=55513 RepID=UPI001262C579|nr:anti-H(O) lectin 1-like [Pistacia vera]
MAFFLAPQGSRIPSDATRDRSLGLTVDSERLNSTSNPFVAIEIDIFHNYYDPPGDHMGINIDSVKSLNNVTWWSDVRVMLHLYYQIDLRPYLPKLVTFGFLVANVNNLAIQTFNSWEFSSRLAADDNLTNPIIPDRRENQTGLALRLGLGIGVGIFVVVPVLV